MIRVFCTHNSEDEGWIIALLESIISCFQEAGQQDAVELILTKKLFIGKILVSVSYIIQFSLTDADFVFIFTFTSVVLESSSCQEVIFCRNPSQTLLKGFASSIHISRTQVLPLKVILEASLIRTSFVSVVQSSFSQMNA
jgi:hypothetical protein